MNLAKALVTNHFTERARWSVIRMPNAVSDAAQSIVGEGEEATRLTCVMVVDEVWLLLVVT